MAYSAAVERWRPLVEKYFRPEDVDKALYVINLESGGNPTIKAKVPSEQSWGLFQLNIGGGLGTGYTAQQLTDPETNVKIAAQAVYGGSGWKPWGEGATYNGKSFGALGTAPYSGGRGFTPPPPGGQNMSEYDATASASAEFPEPIYTTTPGGGGAGDGLTAEERARLGGGAGAATDDTPPGAPTIRVDAQGRGWIWDRAKQDFVPDPRWDAPAKAEDAKTAAPAIRTAPTGEAYEWDKESGNWVRAPRWDSVEKPKTAQGSITAAELTDLKAEIRGSVARVVNRDGSVDVYTKQPDGTFDYKNTEKPAAGEKQREKSKIEVAADINAGIGAQIRGAKGAGTEFAQDTGTTTGAPTTAGQQFATTGSVGTSLEEQAPNQMAASRQSSIGFAPTSALGQPGQFSHVRVPTGPGAFMDVNPSQIQQFLATAGMSPSGEATTSGASSPKALTDEDVARALNIQNYRMGQLATGMSPLEVQAGMDAQIKRKAYTAGAVNEFGQPIEEDQFNFAAPGQMRVDEPVNFVTDQGQTIARAAEVPGSSETISFSGVQPAAPAFATGGDTGNPIGSTGVDWEGNPIWKRNRAGKIDTGSGFQWGSMGPMKLISSREQMEAEFNNRILQAQKERLQRQGRWREAARIQLLDPSFPNKVQPGMVFGNGPSEFAAAPAVEKAPAAGNLDLNPEMRRLFAVLGA